MGVFLKKDEQKSKNNSFRMESLVNCFKKVGYVCLVHESNPEICQIYDCCGIRNTSSLGSANRELIHEYTI